MRDTPMASALTHAERLRAAARDIRLPGVRQHEPLSLSVKEGLALLNATEGMLACLTLACADLELLCTTADVVCALSVEALLGTDAPFAARLHDLGPHPGQAASAAKLRRLLEGSPILASPAAIDGTLIIRTQDELVCVGRK